MSAPEPSTLEAAAEKVVRQLRAGGFEAVFAGGCVRDMLRGVEAKDYDVATSARPAEVQRIFSHSRAVGAHFGVIIVPMGGHHFEVATFRTDGSYLDGRRPESVEFATAEEDAQRRDFTVNGLFFDPIGKQVIDYVGGRADLEAKVLRAIGDPAARFGEDRLRLLRAVRFAAALEFGIEDRTWAALKELAPTIRDISVERIREEISRILLDRHRVRGFDLLCDSGLMEAVIPEVLALKGCEQPPEFHPEGDVFVHTRLMLSLLPEKVSLPLVLSVLLHDIAKPVTRFYDPVAGRARFNEHDRIGAEMTGAILRRLRFSNEVTDATVEMVAQHMAFMNVQKMRTAKLRRFMARPTFEQEMELHRVDCLGSNGFTDNYEFLLHKREEFANEPIIPPRLVDGRALMALGFPPGPVLGRVLNEIQTLQLEGQLTSAEDAIAWARKRLASPDPASSDADGE